MTLFGLTITRRTKEAPAGSMAVSSRGSGGWWPLIHESLSGAWQQGVKLSLPDALTSGPVFACVTLIASDIAKLELQLRALQPGGTWAETTNPAYSPVLRRPNHYQNSVVFLMSWVISKLTTGNSYILKKRDSRGVVNGLYPLDPQRVKPLVAPNGDVYYQVSSDTLSGVMEAVSVPAREIIHDIFYPLYHPLVGVSPLHAAGTAALHGLKIQQNATAFFDQGAQISGVLVAPGKITAETAARLEEHWNQHYAGPQNAGKIVALGDGLKFEPMQMTARESQQSEQAKDAAIEVCNAYHVPAWMVGYGPEPNYNNGEAKYQQYYSQCLQILIVSIEKLLDEGLDLPSHLTVDFDVYEGLLRMDTATKMEVATKGLRGIYKPNEARLMFNKPPVEGGDVVYMQEQDHSLAALSRRDQSANPFASATATPTAAPADVNEPEDAELEDEDEDDLDEDEMEKAIALLRKELAA